MTATYSSKSEHIISALVSICALIGALYYLHVTVYKKAALYVGNLQISADKIKQTGSVFTNASFNDPKLLPVFGASEMYLEPSPFMSTEYFKDYHSGFNIFNLAFSGDPALIEAEELGALGPSIRGKKVVVSFTPKQFYVAQQERNYTGLFSDLHANELLFNDALTLTIKQRVASRMINYPKSLAKDPTLGFIAAHMQYGKASAPYEYYLMYPYSKLRTTIKQLQDEARTLTYMDSKKPHPINTTPGKYANTSQAELLRLAEAEDRNQSSSNDIGLYNRFASKHPDDLVQKPIGSGDKGFLDVLNSSKEYSDFKLMLDILKQLGAQPMLLSRPIKEQLYTRMGVSVPTQEKYYAKMTKLITPYNFDYEDFHQYDTNSYFGADIAPHTGATGWVYVNQELDRFYHAN